MKNLFCLALLFLTSSVPATYPEARGDQLIEEYLNQSLRQNAILSMVVDYQEEQKEPIHLEFTWMRRMRQGLLSHLIRMEAPPSEKGKLLLVHEKSNGDAEYIAYRPNSALLKKVRVSGARHYKYKGFSISVQELIGGELLKYSHQYKGTERLNGIPCQVVENKLQSQFKSESNYPQSLLYLRDDNGMALRWELFGNSNQLEKIIQVDELKKIGGFWTAARVHVQDLKKKGWLRLTLKEGHANPDLKDQWFSEEYLKQNSR